MSLSLPLLPVYLVDFSGSGISLLVAVGCAVCSRRLSRRDRSNALWTYLFWISMAFAAFAVSRSVGHMLKYLLTLSGRGALWNGLSPVSGAINSMTFVFVATLTFYYERVKRSYRALRMERDQFREAQEEIGHLNLHLHEEMEQIRESERNLERAHDEISRLIDRVQCDGDLSVRYSNPNRVRCWEAKSCVHEDCPAHGSEHLRCWHVGHLYCCSLKEDEGEGGCRCEPCGIYRSAHEDPISRLGERFNDMMHILEEKARELTEANRGLMEMDKRKSKFLDIVAHDLRTPLTSILSYADLLLRYKSEPQETRDEFLRTIIYESHRLSDLINDYLDLSKIESGLMEYRIEPLDFREVIDHAVSVYTGVCLRKGILVQTEGLTRDLTLLGDKQRLIQVMSNLLSNAAKFTPNNGKIEIRAGTSAGGDEVRVSISDTGPGIPEEHLEDIFKKFVQVQDGELHTTGGTGLGLPICREIVDFHGGRVWAENGKRGGACLHVALPVQGPPVSAPGEENNHESHEPHTHSPSS